MSLSLEIQLVNCFWPRSAFDAASHQCTLAVARSLFLARSPFRSLDLEFALETPCRLIGDEDATRLISRGAGTAGLGGMARHGTARTEQS